MDPALVLLPMENLEPAHRAESTQAGQGAPIHLGQAQDLEGPGCGFGHDPIEASACSGVARGEPVHVPEEKLHGFIRTDVRTSGACLLGDRRVKPRLAA